MKTMLISGGSDGLGKALAAASTATAQVVIMAANASTTSAAAKELGCDFVVADVADYDAVSKAVGTVFAKYGAIDVLVNNAGIWIQGPLGSNEPARMEAVMAVNALGTVNLTRAVLPLMMSAKRGRIININSQAGLEGKAERSVYTASKWAITGFTRSLHQELDGSGVTITGFYPGKMKTQLFAKAGNEKDLSDAIDVADAVRALTFVIETPDHISIPELGIEIA